MNILSEIHRGSLYHLDETFLSDVGYKWLSATKAVFMFPEDPKLTFPTTVSFQPIGELYDNISFTYQLTGGTFGKDDLGTECYKATGTAEGVPEFRNDLRVSVSLPIDIELEDRRIIKGTMTDISAGGFMFITEETLPLGMNISFTVTLEASPLFITGEIKHHRLTRTATSKGYGCEFKNLLSKTESSIRGFVFREEVIQRKKKVSF